ncbi:hypothetical protein HK104_010693 [Borealophlyctis nickersoniae]|nr:hypothetical protein HK104_010693 [Borealophlyctis nickersoniae]
MYKLVAPLTLFASLAHGAAIPPYPPAGLDGGANIIPPYPPTGLDGGANTIPPFLPPGLDGGANTIPPYPPTGLSGGANISPPFLRRALSGGATLPPYLPPGPYDVRSPCPMLNSLANHGMLPRNGRNIPVEQYISVLKEVGCAADLCGSIAYSALALVPTRKNAAGEIVYGLDDLRKHGGIEHDASLTRDDFNLSPNQDNFSLNQTLYAQLISFANSATGRLDITSMAKARKVRQADSKARNPNPDFGPQQFYAAHGEAARFLLFFGHQFGNEVPVKVAAAVLLEERLPWAEGWVPPKVPIGFALEGATAAAIEAKEALVK